eukprot:scaffold10826_cov136-Skeletonema_menzelii.AAC.6
MSGRPLILNARHIRSVRYLLLIGLLITIFAPFILIAWHERFGTEHQHRPLFHPQSPHLLTSPSLQQPTSKLKQINNNIDDGEWPPVLTVYSEPDSSYDAWYENPSTKKQKLPLPQRNVHKKDLTRQRFPTLTYQHNQQQPNDNICNKIPTLLPIDQFGTTILDPYLPWIHDLFLSDDKTTVNIIAQNRRRCHKGKAHKSDMDYWEGQVALFQPVAVTRVRNNKATVSKEEIDGSNHVQYYRLSSHEEADEDGLETRFICRFKTIDVQQQTVEYAGETLSTYNFNYEFINWRKSRSTMVETGKDFQMFWLSPLAFNCPVPAHLQQDSNDDTGQPSLLLDIIPIRTPVRRNDVDGFFFHKGHGGPMTFDATKMWGQNHILPRVEDSGRWENLPVCHKPQADLNGDVAIVDTTLPKKKPHRLVACTWTSAIHQRRGNERRISDGKARLREWIAFNLEVGFDHIYIFDNTGANATIFRLKNEVDPDFGSDTKLMNEADHDIDDLRSVTDLFPTSKVTHIEWPATICNNNRPAHDDPGERSSQYAAEAACRARYGPSTDWMASMDPDEYFVPMGEYTSWKQILDKVDKEEGRSVLKFR